MVGEDGRWRRLRAPCDDSLDEEVEDVEAKLAVALDLLRAASVDGDSATAATRVRP